MNHQPLDTPRRFVPAVIHGGAFGGTSLVDGLTAAGSCADLWSLDLGGDAAGWVEVGQAGIAPAPRANHDAVSLGGISLFPAGLVIAGRWPISGCSLVQ
jgi:hypothetical protein